MLPCHAMVSWGGSEHVSSHTHAHTHAFRTCQHHWECVRRISDLGWDNIGMHWVITVAQAHVITHTCTLPDI